MTFPRVSPPHIRRDRTTSDIMTDVCIALLPCAVAAVWFFGIAALLRLAVAVASSLAAGRLTGRRDDVDAAAVVTGLIVCLSCPAQVPLWLLTGGCFFAVCIMRDGFGGIGQNMFNPAMAARSVMLTVFPAQMIGYGLPDNVSAATPLITGSSIWSLLVGRVAGSMGETSVLMIGVGLAWLLVRRVVRFRVPFLATAAFCIVMLATKQDVLAQLLSGSFLFGAVFIFTDFTGKPTTAVGEVCFAVLVGALTALLRLYGRYPEGVCFAVLAVNLLTPFIERITIPKGVKP